MTYRERKERRLEKRQEWAESRDRKSQQAFDTAHILSDQIPLGQPILVGHHSEKRHRKQIERIHSNMDKAVESSKMAEHHHSTAAGIAHQLDTSIYSDDADAIERLEDRIADLEAERQHMKDINKAIKMHEKRTGKANSELTGADLAECGCTAEDVKRMWPQLYGFRFPSYAMQNIGGNIKRNRDRLEQIRRCGMNNSDVPLETILRAPKAVTHKEKPTETQGLLLDAPRKPPPVDPRQPPVSLIGPQEKEEESQSSDV